MRVSEAMTRECQAVKASESLKSAAQIMRDQDIGALFVNDDSGKVKGIITDRDIAVRAVASAAGPDTAISRFITEDVIACHEDDDLEEAARMMEDQQVRRLMVCNRNEEPTGVLAQADVARALGRSELTGELLQEVSKPGGKHSQH